MYQSDSDEEPPSLTNQPPPALPNPIHSLSAKIASHTLPSIHLTTEQTRKISETFTALNESVAASVFSNNQPSLETIHPVPDANVAYSTQELQRMDLVAVGAVATEMYFAAGLTPSPVVKTAISMLLHDSSYDPHQLMELLTVSFKPGVPVEVLMNAPFRNLFTKDLSNAYSLLLKLSPLQPAELVAEVAKSETTAAIKSLSFVAFELLLPIFLKSYTVAEASPDVKSLSEVTRTICTIFGTSLASKLLLPAIMQLLEDLLESSEDSSTNFLKAILLGDLVPMLYQVTAGEVYIPSVIAFLISVLAHPHHRGAGVEESAVICLVGLTLQDNLGPALSARYIVPALTRLIGNPKHHAHSLLSATTSFIPITDMHSAQALTAILPQITEEAIGPMVCERIFADQIPTLQQHLLSAGDPNSASVQASCSSLIECVFVLHSALPCLSPEMIYYQYVTNPPLPLHQLLLILLGAISESPSRWDPNNLFFLALTETTSLLSSVCCCIRVHHVEAAILPAADTFFGTIHDHYSQELSKFSISLATLESEQKVTLSIAEMAAKHQAISLEVLSLPGMETARELYHTIVEICGSDIVTEKCVSANMLIKWFSAQTASPESPSSAETPVAAQSISDDLKTLFIPTALGWIKKRVKNLSQQRESEVSRRQSVDSFGEPQVKLDLTNSNIQPQTIQRDNSGIIVHNSDDEEMKWEDPLGVGGDISALIGLTQDKAIDNINFMPTGGEDLPVRPKSMKSVKDGANHDSMAELVMEDYIDGAVELQPTTTISPATSSFREPSEKEDEEEEEEEDPNHYGGDEQEVLSTRVSQARINNGGQDLDEETDSENENENEIEQASTPKTNPSSLSSNISSSLTPPSGSLHNRGIATKPQALPSLPTLPSNSVGNPQLQPNSHPHNQESRRVDRTWLLGSNFINNTPTPWKKIGTPWSTHMVLLSSLVDSRNKGNPPGVSPQPIRALATNSAESVLCSGGRNGEVLIWNLRSHPPRPASSFSGHRISTPNGYYKPDTHELYDEGDLRTGEILQVSLLDQGNRGVVCDGNLHVWDVETNQTVANMKRSSCVFQHHVSSHGEKDSDKLNWFGRMEGVVEDYDRQNNGSVQGWGGATIFKQSFYGHAMSENDPIVGFKALPVGAHIASDGFCSASESLKIGQQLVCISANRLLHIDLREGAGRDQEVSLLTMPSTAVLRNHCEACFGIGTVVPKRLCSRHRPAHGVLSVASSWVSGEFSPPSTQKEMVPVSFSCLATCTEGNWICVGDSGGFVVCFERRAGRILHKWKAHDDGIVQIYVVNQNQVFTVSKDKSAILWDLRGIDKPQRMSGITELPMRGPGLSSNSVELRTFAKKEAGKVSNVLYCVSGHKCAAAAIPPPGEGDFKVKHRNFCDPAGQKVQKKKLCSRAMLLLPLRSLMVLGCEDGEMKFCV
jgi:hypothetical protein